MTGYYMLRSFDHAGYYETRMLLMVVAVGVAVWFQRKRNDNRFWVMLISGIVFQAIMEYVLQELGLRGKGYQLSAFGITMSGIGAQLVQGFVEGGIFSLMAFWFVDLKDRPSDLQSRKFYLGVCTLIVVLAFFVGYLSIGQPVTSPRPIFIRTNAIYLAVTVGSSVVLCAWRGGSRYLGLYTVGLIIYMLVTFVPLQVMGARYIGVRADAGTFAAASLWPQIWVMLYSHLIEVPGGKVHYFAIPFALGLVRFAKKSAASVAASA